MNSEDEYGEKFRHEAARLMDVVRFLARTLGLDNAKLSQKAKVPVADVERYFKGEEESRLEVLLALVHALGMKEKEFFELAYPEFEKPEEPSDAFLKANRLLDVMDPGRKRWRL